MGEQEHRVLELVPLFPLSCSITFFFLQYLPFSLWCSQYPCPFTSSLSISQPVSLLLALLSHLSLSLSFLYLLSLPFNFSLIWLSIIILSLSLFHGPFFLAIIPLFSFRNTPCSLFFSGAVYHRRKYVV